MYTNLPKSLDTPEKQRQYLDVLDQIKKHKGYITFYKKEIVNVKRNIERCERVLRELKALKAEILKGRKEKKPKQGWLKFEEEE